MADTSPEGELKRQATVDETLAVMEKNQTAKRCNGLHALSEAFITYAARELRSGPEKHHALEIASMMALRSGYEAIGPLTVDEGGHGLDTARLHSGVAIAVRAIVAELFRMSVAGANCPGCASKAVLLGVADGLVQAGVSTDMVVTALNEKFGQLRVNGAPVLRQTAPAPTATNFTPALN